MKDVETGECVATRVDLFWCDAVLDDIGGSAVSCVVEPDTSHVCSSVKSAR